ncbi:hypothetical protein B0I35DRAFT_447121 [Stachybotrys elegans]|uniref:Myb-like domain-containing protein n=1 Tax=Stachybotrys elegans TaxID=80388 RepID=A0A8K0WJ92_9HYPO|nr:hypothetical protein B0I35DRAFT_447121 [Stachybotrys elegans]
MDLKFQMHDAVSMRKRCQEKEAKREHRNNARRAQDRSRDLQQQLHISRDASKPFQSREVFYARQAPNMSANSMFEANDRYEIKTASKSGNTYDIDVASNPIGINANNTDLDSPLSLSWLEAASGQEGSVSWPPFSYEQYPTENESKKMEGDLETDCLLNKSHEETEPGVLQAPGFRILGEHAGLETFTASLTNTTTEVDIHTTDHEDAGIALKWPVKATMMHSPDLQSQEDSTAASVILYSAESTSFMKNTPEAKAWLCPSPDEALCGVISDRSSPASSDHSISVEHTTWDFQVERRGPDATSINLGDLRVGPASDEDRSANPEGPKRRKATDAIGPVDKTVAMERSIIPAIDSPETRDVLPETLLPDNNMSSNQACTSCGIDRVQLLRLSQNVLSLANLSDIDSLVALLVDGRSISECERREIALYIALGSLRDYILGPQQPTLETHSQDLGEPFAAKTSHQDLFLQPSNEMETDGQSEPSLPTPLSDLDDSGDATSDTCRKSCDIYGRDQNDNRSIQGPRARPWSKLEEKRLRVYKMENLSSKEIAEKLKRSESAVLQHWRIMQRDKYIRRR